MRQLAEQLGIELPPDDELVYGAVIGTVQMTDCVEAGDRSVKRDPFAFGPYCHIYSQATPLAKPLPMRGQLGLWGLGPITC